jgi:E3 ubiquitin-protein ligase RAD18
MKGKEENYLVPNWGLQSVINTYKDMRAVLYQYVLNGQDLEKIHRTTNKNDGQSNIDQDTTIVTKSNEEVFHCQNNNVSATAAPQLITSTVAQYDQTKHMEQQSKRPRRSCQRNNQPCYKEENMDEGAENAKYMIVSPPSTAATFQPLSSTTTSTTTTIATPTGAPSDSNVKMNHSTSSPLPTPVPTLHSFSTATNSQNAKPMKRIPPFRFHGTKRNQLIRWCQEHSLPINGSDDDRTWRLKNFADLWNAECDSMNPRPKEILIKQLKMRESTEKVRFVPLFYEEFQLNALYYVYLFF